MPKPSIIPLPSAAPYNLGRRIKAGSLREINLLIGEKYIASNGMFQHNRLKPRGSLTLEAWFLPANEFYSAKDASLHPTHGMVFVGGHFNK